MCWPFILVLPSIFLFLNSFILAVEVAPNSPCAPLCIDKPGGNVSDWAASTTLPSDLTCDDALYSNTTTGQKWVNCLKCESSSGFWDIASNENDAFWFLREVPWQTECFNPLDVSRLMHSSADNSRYTLIWCLFSSSPTFTPASKACGPSCGPIQTQLQDKLNTGDMTSQYNYCGSDLAVSMAEFDACISCLDTINGVQTLLNCRIDHLCLVNTKEADGCDWNRPACYDRRLPTASEPRNSFKARLRSLQCCQCFCQPVQYVGFS